MTNSKDEIEKVEEKVEQKTKRRESKKRKRMPVAGKSVFTIKKILEEK